METFGQRLRWARERAGLTQADIGQMTGLSLTALHRIEHDESKPRPTTATKLAKALHVRVEWLTVGEQPMVWLADMTPDAQIKAQSGKGTEGLPGFVVVDGGPWYRERGEWRVEGSKKGKDSK